MGGIQWKAVAIVALVLATWPANWCAMRSEWGFYENDPAHEWAAPEWGYHEGTRGPAPCARAWSLLLSPITLPAALVVEAAERSTAPEEWAPAWKGRPRPPCGCQGVPPPTSIPDPPGIWILPMDPPSLPPLDPEMLPGPVDPGRST
jgi:hypothetical protein